MSPNNNQMVVRKVNIVINVPLQQSHGGKEGSIVINVSLQQSDGGKEGNIVINVS